MSGSKQALEDYDEIAKDFITPEEAKALLRRKSKRSIYVLCERGALPSYKVGGRLYLRKSEVVEALLKGLVDVESRQESEGVSP